MKLIKLGLFFLFLAVMLSACGGGEGQPSTKEYVLTTALENGTPVFLGVGDEINGIVNPKLSAEAGQVITVTLVNGGEGRHQIVFPDVKAETDVISQKGESTSVTFRVPAGGEDPHQSPGHTDRQVQCI